jgi:TonB family protein
MFDFVISRNQERRSAKRIFASWAVSCLMHFIALILLMEYPELLRGGIYQHIHKILQPQEQDDSQNWRTITVLQPKMTMPSAETLKKLLSASEKKSPGTKPIHIRLDELKAVLSNQPANPKPRPDAKNSSPSLPTNEAASSASKSAAPETGNAGSLAGKQNDGNAGKQPAASLPPPEPEPKSEAALNNLAPSKIPNPILAPSDPSTISAKNVKTPEGETKAIHSPESGILDPNDTKGFPMGEYTSHIVEMIKEKWFIPSYLKNSQGHTTVAFHIDRNGRTINVRILAGSGSNSLDISALNAVLSCSLPALPKGFPGDQVGARFVFSYNEHQ